MSADALGGALLATAAVVAAAWAAGAAACAALVPRGRRAERIGWGFAAGTAILAAGTGAAYSAALGSPAIGPILLAAVAAGLGRRFALGDDPVGTLRGPGGRLTAVTAALAAVALYGLIVYAARALAEPLWPNDYFAIWGMKAKTFFAERAIPLRLFTWPSFEFSNPGYPLGLPLLYAGIASILGRWEDHALALLFPCWLAATLAVLYGWLRRRGAPPTVAAAAGAAVACFAPLYAAPLTGMAEAPLAFALLLLGTALADAMDETDPGARRRLALAAAVAAGTKNEGLFVAGIAALLLAAAAFVGRDRAAARRAALALIVPAVACALLHRLAVGSHPVRGIDLAYLKRPDLGDRLAEALRATWTVHLRSSWLPIAACLVLLLAGRSVAHGNRLLLLGGLGAATYLFLPALCPYGPLWLVTWTQGRNFASLAPLLAAAVAARLAALPRGGAAPLSATAGVVT